MPSVASVGSSSTSPRVASVTSPAPPSRNSCFSSRAEAAVSLRCVAGLQGCVQDLEAVDVHRACRLVGQARRLEVRPKLQLRNSGALVSREAAVQGVVDVVGLGYAHHEVGGRAEPVPAGEEELPAAHNVPRVHCQGQSVAVRARGVGGQDHAAAAAGANRPV